MHLGFIEVPLICIPLILIFRFSHQKDDLQYALFLTLLFGIIGITMIFLAKFYVTIS